jgi:hypothetical protein
MVELLVAQEADYSPFILEAISQLKHLHLDLSLAFVFQESLVRLPLPVSQTVEVLWVRGRAVAGFEGREVALNIAGSAATSRRGEAYIV